MEDLRILQEAVAWSESKGLPLRSIRVGRIEIQFADKPVSAGLRPIVIPEIPESLGDDPDADAKRYLAALLPGVDPTPFLTRSAQVE